MAQRNLEVSQPTKRELYPEVKMLLKMQKIRPSTKLFKKKVKDLKKKNFKSSSKSSESSRNKSSLIISIPLNLSGNSKQT